MMENLVEIIRQRKDFKNVRQLSGDVWSFIHESNDKSISQIFVDLSDAPISGAGPALDKQKHLVEKEFYSTNGSLQWNLYYYYILSDERFQRLKNSEIKREIESDTGFSRKKVVSSEEILRHYPFQSIIEKASLENSSYKDLSSEWIRVLKGSQLDEIYSEDATYDEAIERYLSSNPRLDAEESIVQSVDGSIEIPDAVEKLMINSQFRSHKPETVYDFSKVNLIEGVNGVGKTSLMEGIELLMCGKSFRQKNLTVEEANISLKYKNLETLETFEPQNLKKYKERDRIWYGAPAVSPQSNLHNSFNRFNFFNTDASYRLATKDEPSEIWKNFEALSLGGKTTELSKRITGFHDRFKKEHKKISDEISTLKAESEKDQVTLAQLEKQGNAGTLDVERINSLLLSIGVRADITADDPETIKNVVKDLSPYQSYLKSIVEAFNDKENVNFEYLDSVRKYVDDRKGKISANETKISEVKAKIEKNTIEGKSLRERQSQVNRLLEYVNSEEALRIGTIQTEVSALSAKVSKLKVGLSNISYPDTVIPEEGAPSVLVEEIRIHKDSLMTLEKKRGELDVQIKHAKFGSFRPPNSVRIRPVVSVPFRPPISA